MRRLDSIFWLATHGSDTIYMHLSDIYESISYALKLPSSACSEAHSKIILW